MFISSKHLNMMCKTICGSKKWFCSSILQKYKVVYQCYSTYKNELKWIINLNVRAKKIKLLEENTIFSSQAWALRCDTKSLSNENKIGKLGIIKIKNHSGFQRQYQKSEKTIQVIRLFSFTHKELLLLLHLNNK